MTIIRDLPEIGVFEADDGSCRIEASRTANGEVLIDVTDDWWGDSETGFGATVGMTMTRGDAEAFARFILAAIIHAGKRP